MEFKKNGGSEELQSDRDQLLRPVADDPEPLKHFSDSRRKFCWILVGGLVFTLLLTSNVALWAQVRSVRRVNKLPSSGKVLMPAFCEGIPYLS